MRTITLNNSKGGCGKSSTALALSYGLALKGYKVLAVDLDHQGNFTYTSGVATTSGGATSVPTVLDVLLGNVDTKTAIQHADGIDILISSKNLSSADIMISQTGKEYRLREALEPVQEEYDFCIVDTPPALGILSINALTASDDVIIPAQADIYSIQGINALSETIQTVRKYCNKNLRILGVVLTRYSSRAILSREVAQLAAQVAATLGTALFESTIREGISVKEAQLKRQSLFSYAPKMPVTQDYADFVNEFLTK